MIRTRDFDAWKKELEFWRSRENGRHDLKVLFASMEVIKDWQLVVILLLKPVSKGVGNADALSVVATTRPLDVLVGASVDVDELRVVELEEDELELSVLRRRRSSAVSGRSSSQLLGSGGGR